jgi:sialate O-acetylesterase
VPSIVVIRLAAIVLLALVLAVADASAQRDTSAARLRLPRIFGNGMVMQRDTRIPVWGWAPPRTAVVVSLGGTTRNTSADASGAWRLEFPPLRAGGPHRMSITGGGERIEVTDILTGDVWVAAGQSNMEWPVGVSDNAAAEIASARDSSIRELSIPHSYSENPETDVVGGQWASADSQHVARFSGVGYFFARDLRKSVDVPIGIIHASWGGSNVETWMSRQALGLNDSTWRAFLSTERGRAAAQREALRAKVGSLPTVDSGLVDGRAIWAAPELVDDMWAMIPTPGLWEAAGYAGMDGVAWYRTSFALAPEETREAVRLSLGPIDDADITWVNGVEVGRTEPRYAEARSYTIPASALRAGRNVIAVRVDDTGGGGGIYGDPSVLWIEVGGVRRPLAGDWRFKVGRVSFHADDQRINKVPTALYNRMIHPLLDVPIKGVIWYQGESNANSVAQATEYRRLFSTLISSWRREWRGTKTAFPFLWVQLPNFGRVDSVPPATAGWATLRESQSAALALPNTGQVVAIDLGGAAELHPTNKQDVGARLALKAREVAYGQRVVSSGPRYRGYTINGGRVTVELANVGGGLVSRAKDSTITGFAIAGADRRFVWANARVEGSRIVVWSSDVSAPIAVRYLWTNSPLEPMLYNREGLPLEPFRTDDW